MLSLMTACGGDAADEPGEAADSTPSATPSGAPGAAAAGSATEVTPDQLKTAPDQFVGREVRVSNIGVATPVGTQAFFIDVPQSPFLVKMDQALIAQSRPLPTGTVTVIGPMRAMNDSIMRDWLAKGHIAAGDQILVEFATHFIEARSVEPATGAPPAP
jgi:hypothetical protein